MSSCFDLTIITVCYNSEKTIARTFQSVIAAAVMVNCNIEYLIIDGASSDNTLDIIQSMMINVPQNLTIRISSEKDRGIYDAMNKGIYQSSGDVVGFLNSDDEYLTDTISVITEAFKLDEQIDVIHGDVIWRYSHSGSSEQCAYHAGDPDLENLISGMVVNHPTLYCRRDVYKCFGYFDDSFRFVADWKWSCDIFLSDNHLNVKYLAVPFVVFDMGGASSQVTFARYMEIARVHFSNYKAGFSNISTLIHNFAKLYYECAFSLAYHALLPLRYREKISKIRKAKFSFRVEK